MTKDCTTCGSVGCDHKDVSKCGPLNSLWEPRQGAEMRVPSHVVMNQADIESYFTDAEQECLGILLAKYDRCRRAEGKKPLDCAVFERNEFWPAHADATALQSEVALMREISHAALERLEKIAHSPANADVRGDAMRYWKKLIKRIDETPNA